MANNLRQNTTRWGIYCIFLALQITQITDLSTKGCVCYWEKPAYLLKMTVEVTFIHSKYSAYRSKRANV